MDKDSKQPHPDRLESPDPIIDAIFTKIMDDYTFSPEGQKLERLHTVGLAVNDPERPSAPDIRRHETARHFGLDRVGHNTASLGALNGYAYLDPDGDVFAAFVTHPSVTNSALGVCFVVNGQQAWLPRDAVNDMIQRFNTYPITTTGAWDPLTIEMLTADDDDDDDDDEDEDDD